MKKVISILLILVLAFYLMIALNRSLNFFNPPLNLNENSLSTGIIHKNTQGENQGVVFGKSANLEEGSANLVTSIVVNYRSFDTLGEVTVLFVSALGVGLLLGASVGGVGQKPSGFILKTASSLIAPLMMVVGVYMMSHGHLTPGGGFPGGSIIAIGFLLKLLGTDEPLFQSKFLKVLESSAGVVYILLGLAGLYLAGSFLQNFIPTGTVGHLLSAGVVPMIYTVVGLKVGAEVSGIIYDFSKSEVSL